jgi:hypothetical protein
MGQVILPVALSEHCSSEVSLVLNLALESCSGATSEASHVLGLTLGVLLSTALMLHLVFEGGGGDLNHCWCG